MYKINLHIPGQPVQSVPLPDGVFQLGAGSGNHLQLNAVGVSQRHCRFSVQGDKLYVSDLGSSNGTFCDGVALSDSLTLIPPGAVLMVGQVRIEAVGNGQAPEKVTAPAVAEKTVAEKKPVSEEEAQIAKSISEAKKKTGDPDEVPVLAVSGIPEAARPVVQKIKKLAHVELLKRLDLKRAVLNNTSESALEEQAKSTIHEIMGSLTIPLPAGVTAQKIEQELYFEAVGLGPLEKLIAMDTITEIMVNGPDKIYVEHKGVIYRTDMAFADSNQVLAAIERIVSPLGRRIDESSPMVDARLKDGSRVNAIIPPLSLIGPSITIRKFSRNPLQVKDLIKFGSITQEIADFLDVCVKLRKNIVISGGTGSGKTTLLNILSGFLPNRERIVTIEDAAELQLRQEHVVRLESRPANIEGKGEIAIRDLVKNSLRMRPDRIVIGECRGGEALDMLQAMNTGHDGSLTTIHANTPRDCLSRLETLVLMAGFDLPLRAIREQIASAITIVVQINREKDGSRKVTCVSEITKMEGDIITMQDLFVYKQSGWTEDGKMIGDHVATGSVPTFMDEIKRAELPLDISIFTPPKQNRGGGLF